MKKTPFLMIMILFGVLMSLSLFGNAYMLIPIGDFYYDPILARLKPSFTPEGGIVTKVMEANHLEIEMDGATSKHVTVKLIGTSIEEWSEEQKTEARAFTQKHIEGHRVLLSYDWNPNNEDGDLLAYVWKRAQTTGRTIDVLWNAVLLVNGYARVCNEPFRVDYQAIFHDIGAFSEALKLGLLKEKSPESPVEWASLPEFVRQQLVRTYYEDLTNPPDKVDDEWIYLTTFYHPGLRGVIHEERRLVLKEGETTTESYYTVEVEVGRESSIKEEFINIDSLEWKISWKIYALSSRGTIARVDPPRFMLEISDEMGWRRVLVNVDSMIPGTDENEIIIRRAGNFTFTIQGVNPYELEIYIKNID